MRGHVEDDLGEAGGERDDCMIEGVFVTLVFITSGGRDEFNVTFEGVFIKLVYTTVVFITGVFIAGVRAEMERRRDMERYGERWKKRAPPPPSTTLPPFKRIT